MGYLYHTPFTLELPVHDKKAANAYLQDDDMAEYLRGHLDREHSSLKPEEVLRADWRMKTDQAGDRSGKAAHRNRMCPDFGLDPGAEFRWVGRRL